MLRGSSPSWAPTWSSNRAAIPFPTSSPTPRWWWRAGSSTSAWRRCRWSPTRRWPSPPPTASHCGWERRTSSGIAAMWPECWASTPPRSTAGCPTWVAGSGRSSTPIPSRFWWRHWLTGCSDRCAGTRPGRRTSPACTTDAPSSSTSSWVPGATAPWWACGPPSTRTPAPTPPSGPFSPPSPNSWPGAPTGYLRWSSTW